MIKDFVKDLVKYSPAHIVSAIIGFISIPVITRLFPPHDYGNYSLIMAIVTVLTALLGWLPVSIIRFYPVYEKNSKLGIFYNNVIKLMVISVVTTTVIFLISIFSIRHHIPSELYLLMYIGAVVFIVSSIFEVLQYFLRSKREVNYYTGFTMWKNIMGFALGVGFVVFFKSGIMGLFWGAILSMIIILPLLWKKATECVTFVRSKLEFSLLKETVGYGFPLVIGNLAAWVLSLSDRYILEYFRGAKEVGIYSAGYNISEKSVMIIISLLSAASGPILMRMWEEKGERHSREYINKVTRYYLITCVPVVVGLSVLSGPIMNIFVGAQYYEAYKIIPFVTLGVLFLGLQGLFQGGFLFYKRTGFITFAIGISGLLNLWLNFIFIPRFGYMAAAVTTCIAYAFLLFLMIVGSRRIFAWDFPFRSLAKIGSASVIMGMAVYFIGNQLISSAILSLILGMCLGGLIYLALLFLFQEVKPAEKKAMRQIFAKIFTTRLRYSKLKVK